MSAANRFHLIVSTLTIATMYWLVNQLPLWFPDVKNVNPVWQAILAVPTTVVFYKAVAFVYRLILNHWELAKKFTFGPEYVQGTWIGRYSNSAKELRLTVEHFEQTIDGLVVRGYAFTDQSATPVVDWTSKAASVNASLGELTFSYNCNNNENNTKFEGLADFKFERKHASSAPEFLNGYSADLIGTHGRFPNRERLMSRKHEPLPKAWAEAKK
jgi:hypothetical protein